MTVGCKTKTKSREAFMITFDKKRSMFCIATKDSSYVFGINSAKELYNAYYGKKLTPKDLKKAGEPKFKEIGYHSSDNKKSNFMPEFNAYDGYNIFENTVKASFSDGNRAIDCVYKGHVIKDDTLTVTMKDKKYGFYIDLNYKVLSGYNLIEKSILYRNNETKISVNLESFNSGALVLPPGKYNLGFNHGGWIKEMSLRFEEISHGKKVLESRTGNSSHILNPSFFITRDEKISEDSGEYYYGQLLWGGNWKFTFEKRFYDAVTFNAGINNFEGSVTLKPGKEFQTPSLILGFSGSGLGQMSRDLHDFYRHNVMPQYKLNDHKRVLVNSWEAFYFDINEEKLLKLADTAVKIGAEILVVDDGWFRGRNDDTSSLGDWEPAKKKFPQGMKVFRDKVRAKGLKFGIWLEPEMVNPDSDLYREHPDWCYHNKGRSRTQMRHQLVLNIARKDVFAYLKEMIRRVITAYAPDYVKWDMNRYISEAAAENIKDSTVWIEHMRAAYELMAYLKSLNPQIILEGCAGGGGRFSGGVLKYVDQMWTSDNNDPFCRQFIQYGTSLFYPAIAMCCHVADSPYGLTGRASKTLFRIRTAMAGNFGIEAGLLKWNDKELNLLKQEIKSYKSIRETVYSGDLYRMDSPYDGDRVSFMYVSKDKAEAVVYIYFTGRQAGKPGKLKLKGLNNSFTYEYSINNKAQRKTGNFLMKTGISLPGLKFQDSMILRLNRLF
jgi:alpha-galactosidase